MTPQRMEIQDLRLLGGWLCLDFVNSIENRAGHRLEDFLMSYPDLVRWAQHADLVDDATAERLMVLASADEQRAGEALESALGLRNVLHRIFLAISSGSHATIADLEQLRRADAQAIASATLAPTGERFAWVWRPEIPDFEQPLWPIAHSAVELLTIGDLRRIKVCENPYGCGWLFYDSSKNGSRRWCSMEGCGSQVKMRRLYAKRRATALL